ncbi:MAG: molybdenum cofactor guanylyltransferase [Neisseria sp.]|nr:molybdenum cofactor guanylyltransferase [Neisseria sp.]
MQNTLPLLILCGGLSSRMGSPKPLLPFGGTSLIAWLANQAQRPVWLASGGTIYPEARVCRYLPDALAGRQGPLSAILPALLLARQEGADGVYLMSCDTLIRPEDMCRLLTPGGAPPPFSVLAGAGRTHPLLGYWPARLAPPLQDYLDGGGRRVNHWIEGAGVQKIPMPEEWARLANFNTPEDFARAAAHMAN